MENNLSNQIVNSNSIPKMGYDLLVISIKSEIVRILSDSKLPLSTIDSILLELKLDTENKLKYNVQMQKSEYEKQLAEFNKSQEENDITD